MKSKLFKNLRLQTYLQIINAIIPLITTPFIARVLGAGNIGEFSSSQAIASFFTLFAILGVNNYGVRCISSEKEYTKRIKLFLEIYLMQFITCCIASLSYFFYCLYFARSKTMAFIQFITLFGCFIEISWFYFGVEDFKTVVLSSAIIRIISVFFIFAFVKNKDGIIIYAFIMLGSSVLSQLFLWGLLIKKLLIKKEIFLLKVSIKKHILPNIKLFIPLFAMTICTSTDKAMLGAFSVYEQAGYYSNVDRIINVPFSIFSGIGGVFLPRMTSIYSESKEGAKTFFFDTLTFVIMLGVAVSCGIFAVADSFIPLFLGNEYTPCIDLIKVFSPIIIIKCITNAVRMHYLIPFRKEDIYIKATAIGAFLNIILNYFFIPIYGALGAVYTTLISESIIFFIQIVLSFNVSELKSTIKDLIIYMIIGLLMILILRVIKFVNIGMFYNTIFKVIIGGCFYSSLIVLYWNKSQNKFYQMYIKPKIDFITKGKN